jgi:hypothetical protein
MLTWGSDMKIRFCEHHPLRRPFGYQRTTYLTKPRCIEALWIYLGMCDVLITW